MSVAFDEEVQSYRSRALARMQKHVASQLDSDHEISSLRRELNSYITPSIKNRLEFEMQGEFIRECRYIWNSAALNVVGVAFPQLLQLALRKHGVQLAPITTNTQRFLTLRDAMRDPSTFDAEPTMPDLLNVPTQELIQFRIENRVRFENHIRRMQVLSEENARIAEEVERARHWITARNEMADSGTEILRLLRHTFKHSAGTWGIGVCAAPILLRPNGSTLDRLFGATDMVFDQSKSYIGFILRQVGSTGRNW